MKKKGKARALFQVPCDEKDRRKFDALCEQETRGLKDQFKVILREAYERRGLDFETGEPVKSTQSA